MSHSYTRKANKNSFRLHPTLLSLVLAAAGSSCTLNKDKKSGVRDLAAGEAGPSGALKQMKLKYAFTFLGSGGAKYPIYMSADVVFSDDKKEGTWNSNIDSDGGLVAALNETKTLKPDKNLVLKSAAPETPGASEVFVFNSGNPELGRGLSLKVQRVTSGGTQVWKATALSYFGYEAQLEDSTAVASQTP